MRGGVPHVHGTIEMLARDPAASHCNEMHGVSHLGIGREGRTERARKRLWELQPPVEEVDQRTLSGLSRHISNCRLLKPSPSRAPKLQQANVWMQLAPRVFGICRKSPQTLRCNRVHS